MTASNEKDQTAAPAAPAPSTGINTDPVDQFKCAECGEIIAVAGLPSFSDISCPKCSTKASVPARLSSFLLLRLMGTGGMGGVYYARDEELGRFVAIKVMLESLGSDPAFIENFRREAQAVAKLNHPNIAQIYSYGQEKGQPYIVMELVSGERVDAMMDVKTDGLDPALTMRIGLEIAQGLSAADEAGLVHGDIKPENILLDNKGRAKLVDFGLATVVHAAAGEGIWGTPYYIAPEKIRRQKVDARSDIYSLGATLFHMLTGKPPFEGETPVEVVKARLENPPPDVCEFKPELPEIVANTIKRMLAVERTERYPNYLSLISDLQKCVDELGTTPEQTSRIKGGKQIRFKKRKGSTSTAATGTDGNNSGSRKLVIHREHGQTGSFNRVTKRGTASISVPAGQEPEPPPEPTPEEIAARKERARRLKQKVWAVVISLLLVLAIAAGATWWWLNRQEEIRKRQALFALSNSRSESAELFTAISNNVDRIVSYAQRASSFEDAIQAATERVIGRRIRIDTPAPLQPEPEPDVTTTNITATNVVDDVTHTATAQPDSVPEGDAASTAADTPDMEVDDAPPSDIDGGDDFEVVAAEPDEPDHPIVDPAREALKIIQELEELKLQAVDILTETIQLRNLVHSTGDADAAVSSTRKLRELKEHSTEMYRDLVKKRFDQAEGHHMRVVAIRNDFDRAEEARLEAEKAAEEARLAAEKAEQERQALIARRNSERQQAQTDEADVKGLFSANDFEGALAQLEQRAQTYQTDEGKAAIEVVVERYRYLARMKTILTTGMQQTRYPWGWGFGSSARDIESANEKGIIIKGSADPVPWSSVTTPQLLKLVDFYASSRELRARDRIDLTFGAAIYCDMFPGEKAHERALQYANRAQDLGLPYETFAKLLESRWANALE